MSDNVDQDAIRQFIDGQTTDTLEKMLEVREKFLMKEEIFIDEYTAVKTMVDMIEEEIFVRNISGD